MIKKFSREELDELDVPWTNVSDKFVENTRWSILKECVFKDTDGKHYSVTYRIGATECQDDTDLWDGETTISAVEVELKEIMVKRWVMV